MHASPLNKLIEYCLQARALNALLALASFGAIGVALLMQVFLELEPCPLCIFQRLACAAAGFFFLLSAIHGSKGLAYRIYGVGALISIITGMFIAGRHVWLQHLPADQVPACGPGLDYMVDVFPLLEVFSMVLKGSGECADIDWRFLGLSIPEQTLIYFACMLGFALFQLFRKRK